jgi:Tfp pilus assembly protein PilF
MDRIAKLKEFLQATPSDNFLRHALALEYVKAGDDAKAKPIFETILNESPGYIGSYYHLAKLLERNGEIDAAIDCYEKGMSAAKKAQDNHAYGELKAAFEELTM